MATVVTPAERARPNPPDAVLRCILVGDGGQRTSQGSGCASTQAPDGSRRARPERRAVGAPKAAWSGCAYCGATRTPLQRDCVLALSRGGRYTLDNIVPTCGSCNTSKCNDEVTSWLRRKRLDERAFLLRHLEINGALASQFRTAAWRPHRKETDDERSPCRYRRVARARRRARRRSRAAHRRSASSPLAAGRPAAVRPRRPARRRRQRPPGRTDRVHGVPRRVPHRTGPPELAPVGETEFVAGEARQQRRADRRHRRARRSAARRTSTRSSTRTPPPAAGCSAASATRCRAPNPAAGLMIAGGAPAGLFEDPAFRAGVAPARRAVASPTTRGTTTTRTASSSSSPVRCPTR